MDVSVDTFAPDLKLAEGTAYCKVYIENEYFRKESVLRDSTLNASRVR